MAWSRRRFITAMAGSAVALAAPARGGPLPARIVATSWFQAETLLALGLTPLALTDTATFRERLPSAGLARDVVELGNSWEPNLELLDQLAPDLILLDPDHRVNQPLLARIGPTRVLDVFEYGNAIERAHAALTVMGGWFQRQAQARTAIKALNAAIAAAAGRLHAVDHRPVYLLNIDQGGRHVRIFGPNSILHDTMIRTGLSSAWDGPVQSYGWTTVGIEHLARVAEARIAYLDLGRFSARSLRELSASSLWRSLPAVRAGRVHAIPAVMVHGGALTAARFANLLAERIPADA